MDLLYYFIRRSAATYGGRLARFLEYLNYRSTSSLRYYRSWKLELETESEAEAEGSLYALLQKIWKFHVKRRGFVTENGTFDGSLL